MTKKEQFQEYCRDQVERLGGAFPEFRFLRAGAVSEIAAWLSERAAGDKARAAQFITLLTEFGNMPSMLQMSEIWNQAFPTKDSLARAERERCSRCDGTGFVVVDGPFGTSAAYPCSHQPESEADRRMGVSISPAMAKRYIAEQAEAQKRQVAFLQRRADGKTPGFPRVEQADVDALLESIGEMA